MMFAILTMDSAGDTEVTDSNDCDGNATSLSVCPDEIGARHAIDKSHL